MKIALVSPYDIAHPGGVVSHILALERQFTKMGHQVRIIAPTSKKVPHIGDSFIRIGRARTIPIRGTVIRISLSLRLASRIKEVLAEEKFDIIHLHEPFMPMLCSAVLRFSDAVNIGTFHACQSSPGYNFGWPISRLILRRRRNKLIGKIAVSRTAMDFASKYIPGYYNIIPNGIDLEHFSPHASPIDRFCDGKINILFVGRLEKRKGLNHLLNAYRQVKGEFPNSRLIIVGPGTRLRRKYEKQIRRDSLEDVVFVGYATYDELPSYYKTADIFCSPATGRESFGIVLLEAMAAGKPIVATNIDGYASVLTHGEEGLLAPPEDEKGLAQALISLMADESLRRQMAAKGVFTASEYSWDKVAQKVFAYYLRILSELPGKDHLLKNEIISVSV
jgi:phosphatidylinositol alpha-mannosyltransferase|tara:strand:+ start:4133 stop:5305 length:1173 start_codon:yes stop_codon:yes gene_type:complete